jgi:ring-1,2-phenylacetyl-CoA epoxidase subunit PaaD
MVTAPPSAAEIWTLLREIADPEVPALSIVDLGIVREVRTEPEQVTITITPTYSACPAMDVIAAEIRSSLKAHGIENLRLETTLSPAWTTDWLSNEAKQRLREYGIAPPQSLIPASGIKPAAPEPQTVACPHCGSESTALVSRYGSSLCKALYKCLNCLEPFDAFKQH